MIQLRTPQFAQKGFTIVELMIATLVFSLILVVITSGVIHFTSAYYKGLHNSSTQTTARTVMNTIAQNLQYGGGGGDLLQTPIDDTSADRYICVGDVQIDYKIGAKLGTDSDYGVFVTKVDPILGCTAYRSGLKGQELLAPKMRLTNLVVSQQLLGANNLYDISAGVAYGDLDLLCARSLPSNGVGGCAPNASQFADYTALMPKAVGVSVACKSGKASQFCAFSHLTTQVAARFESVEK